MLKVEGLLHSYGSCMGMLLWTEVFMIKLYDLLFYHKILNAFITFYFDSIHNEPPNWIDFNALLSRALVVVVVVLASWDIPDNLAK